jgi:mono/diheme cytochrome c family protein
MRHWTNISAFFTCALLVSGTPARAAEAGRGNEILQRNCGRCHAVIAGEKSTLAEAPNLFTVLGNYPSERLEVELSEGIGSRHRYMPQIQFSAEEIASIYDYLHAKPLDSEYRRPQ